jgi:CheY-like chemotaxis protein/nitrogen-specific signal transduction histidine kinase
VARDITERKRLQAELQRQSEELRHYADALSLQNQQKDQFMAMLAHELRNPLAPMRTALEILRLKANNPEQVHRVRETLVRQTRNLTRLVDDLLDVSRLTQGKMTHRFERVDLASLARATCGAYQTEADAAGLTMTCESPEVPVWVMGDSTRLDQILDNLIENAIKFSERGGHVNLRLTVENETATLTVKDRGIGIEPELLTQLFDPFTQSDHSLARSRGGLGLGLAIVKGLAELHGGTIDAYSQGLGEGAEFLLTLPAVAELPALTSQQPNSVPDANGKRVLIVEDNRDAADSLAELLTLFGYQVNVAYTGPEGVAAAIKYHPEVILCDIGLPGLDGYEVAQYLRHDPLTASIRLIAVTGYGSEADRKRAQQAGFDTHLVKPVDPDRLLGELS